MHFGENVNLCLFKKAPQDPFNLTLYTVYKIYFHLSDTNQTIFHNQWVYQRETSSQSATSSTCPYDGHLSDLASMRSNQSQMVLTELMGAKANQSVGLALRRVLFTGLYVTVNKATPTHTHYKPTCQTNITVTYMMLAIFPTQHCNQNAKSPPNPSHTHHQSPRILHLVIRAKICLINERTKKKNHGKKKGRTRKQTKKDKQRKKRLNE